MTQRVIRGDIKSALEAPNGRSRDGDQLGCKAKGRGRKGVWQWAARARAGAQRKSGSGVSVHLRRAAGLEPGRI